MSETMQLVAIKAFFIETPLTSAALRAIARELGRFDLKIESIRLLRPIAYSNTSVAVLI